MDAKFETEIADALERGSNDRISPEALKELQTRTRAEGKCGSLQTRSGLPCRRDTRAGFTVCNKHGSRAPQTIAKAERLLAVARIPAIENVLDFLDQYQERTCPTCGYPQHDTEEKRTMLAASKLVLDRTGLGPKATLQVNANKADDTDQLIEHMTEAERVEVAGLVQRLDEIKAAVRLRVAQASASTLITAHGVIDATFTSEPQQ